ncbi:sugar phosphate nucleotidyltransferase [Dyadobacter luteus]|jgi:NDP-sugar pyrophosphorylase family protein|nr:sugar phosphate nucleotidyltransferase [Dyadobacter luteus]
MTPHSSNDNINVVIMAGGKGSRLKSLTENRPKALVEVQGKPVIVHLLEHLIASGFKSAHISVGYLADQIINELKCGSQFGAQLDYIREDRPSGSIGALVLRQDWEKGTFLIINGDVFSNFKIDRLLSAFVKQDADLLILTTSETVKLPWGVIVADQNGKVVRLEEKPDLRFLISSGVYLFNKKVYDLISRDSPMEGWELVQTALAKGLNVVSIPLQEGEYWVDVGTFESLEKARNLTLSSDKAQILEES